MSITDPQVAVDIAIGFIQEVRVQLEGHNEPEVQYLAHVLDEAVASLSKWANGLTLKTRAFSLYVVEAQIGAVYNRVFGMAMKNEIARVFDQLSLNSPVSRLIGNLHALTVSIKHTSVNYVTELRLPEHKIHFTIVFQPESASMALGAPQIVETLNRVAYSTKRVKDFITTAEMAASVELIIDKLTEAAQQAFLQPSMRHLIAAQCSVTFYIFKLEDAGALVSRIGRIFRQNKGLTITFSADSKDIRFFFNFETVRDSHAHNLVATIMHEITHINDPRRNKWTEAIRPLIRVREEALARFQEIIGAGALDPKLIDLRTFFSYCDYPIASLSALPDDKNAPYRLGLIMITQMFFAYLKQPYPTTVEEINSGISQTYHDQAVTFRNLMSKTDVVYFFRYYRKIVPDRMFTEEFFNEVEEFATGKHSWLRNFVRWVTRFPRKPRVSKDPLSGMDTKSHQTFDSEYNKTGYEIHGVEGDTGYHKTFEKSSQKPKPFEPDSSWHEQELKRNFKLVGEDAVRLQGAILHNFVDVVTNARALAVDVAALKRNAEQLGLASEELTQFSQLAQTLVDSVNQAEFVGSNRETLYAEVKQALNELFPLLKAIENSYQHVNA